MPWLLLTLIVLPQALLQITKGRTCLKTGASRFRRRRLEPMHSLFDSGFSLVLRAVKGDLSWGHCGGNDLQGGVPKPSRQLASGIMSGDHASLAGAVEATNVDNTFLPGPCASIRARSKLPGMRYFSVGPHQRQTQLNANWPMAVREDNQAKRCA